MGGVVLGGGSSATKGKGRKAGTVQRRKTSTTQKGERRKQHHPTRVMGDHHLTLTHFSSLDCAASYFTVLHLFIFKFFFRGSKSEASWLKKKQTTVTSASPTTVKGKERAKAKLRHLLPGQGPRSKREETTHSDGASLRLRKVVPGTSLELTYTTSKRHTIEKKEHPHYGEGTKRSNKPTTQANKLFTRKKQSWA